ncbi:consortin, connexin sorting protein b [Pimephales promelas]|uniref:consortin, connexin sorting protein b n=1 Tax=Pimephales promelas TaxID=90988 RepID=UPI0019554CAF|nr:consortin, connexin sorting protein b [Pimephales promelas]XP_039548192.1 consortin, connexin sorting protein b [Pimephales promelas]XP_039548193.1 consortin, connexin sorting protein b [Pimephales promelas]
MGESITRKSVLWKETSTISQTAEDIITSYLAASDENQNKLQEAEVMDVEAVKLDSQIMNPEERSPTNIKSHSCSLDHGTLSGIVPPGPSPSLLASLQSLVEENDHMLLPHSLHQIAEGYFLEEDYQWAVEFLHLEKLYHERLLSNLASIQKKWESQRKISIQTESNSTLNANGTDREREHMEVLSRICRTHQRPNFSLEKNMDDIKLQNSPSHVTEHRRSKQEQASVNSTGREKRAGDSSWLEAEQEPEENCDLNEDEEEEGLDEDEYWNEELQDDTDFDGQVPMDELDSLIQTFPSNGLVSILKKRPCVKETENTTPQKDSTKRKVRFREPDDAFDQDEVSGNSCLVLLFLCLATVVISMGGTALYCLIGEAYSNVCVDFSQNVEFFFGPVRRGVDALTQWLSSGAS